MPVSSRQLKVRARVAHQRARHGSGAGRLIAHPARRRGEPAAGAGL